MRFTAAVLSAALVSGCTTASEPDEFYGTTEPFASEAVYFVVTDRFVNGDETNDHRDQGGPHRTFNIPLDGPDGQTDNIGYQGGDFRGVLDNADYIRDMGFSAVWITPIVDNPDEAFTGGDQVKWASSLTDRGKTGYHGYWGVNFYRVDEHLPSAGLDFAAFTKRMGEKGLKVVLDVVANHGSPSFTMPVDQPKFGELYDASGKLVADHQNLPPEKLDPRSNPLHGFFRTERDLVQLSNLDDENPAVQDYIIGSTLHWLRQGAAALRIDTVRHVPQPFWRTFSERVRAERPGLFMFGEIFDYDAAKIAPYTHPDGGGMSVLDFPLKAKLSEVFEKQGDFALLETALLLTDGPYRNPYELMTFYDNHDMPRMNASDDGFIDAHNWLFTARGIPVVYYGSEIGFMRGRAEHAGNRNYFGQGRVQEARGHRIRENLKRIAHVRQASPALQRGLQLNVRLAVDEAIFYRVYQRDGVNQTALVLLNKGNAPRTMSVERLVEPGEWRDAITNEVVNIDATLTADVPAHGVRVLLRNAPLTNPKLRHALRKS